MAPGQVVISEFLASNDSGLRDDFGEREDWIELRNVSNSDVSLLDWALTDDASRPQKWVFPDVTVPAGGRLLVFASKRDRRDASGVLHTNFSLSKSGEYLALFKADGTTVATEFTPSYPAQAEDVSYGTSEGTVEETVITRGSAVRLGVPSSLSEFNSQFSGWNTSVNGSFNGSRWRTAQSAIGYETDPGGGPFGPLVGAGGNVQSEMRGRNESIFLRMPFTLSSVEQVTSAQLRMRWDDGFVAYLNGSRIAADRAPTSLEWNSRATSFRDDGLNDDQEYFSVDLAAVNLQNGSNLLAIHGLNAGINSSDFLIDAELVLTKTTGTGGSLGYFTTPSPSGANGGNETELAPLFRDVTEEPIAQPQGGSGSAPIVVQAEIQAGSRNVGVVRAAYRTMFGSESQVTMRDDGQGVDATANDNVYTASIPTTQLSAGQMLRWRYIATDVSGLRRTSPAFLDPLDSPQYYGTVAIDASFASSQLPVLQTFVQNEADADTVGGTRAAVYYLGEFYDNIQMDLHGQSSASFPKKSYDLDFNRGNRFRWKADERRVKDLNLLTNWADKSKVRNTVVYELLNRAGNISHFAFPVRVQRNGQFFSVADMVEDGDDRYLDRVGLNEDGALYKMYDALVDPNNAAKKTRKDEGRSDLATFYNQIDTSQGSLSLRRNIYDHVDLAATVNHLVANQVIGITDTGHKNFYLYRDTEGSGEWRPLPWDVDLSMGRRWSPANAPNQYFDDTLRTGFLAWNSNPLWQAIYETPEFREMFVRRFETMRRELFQVQGTSASNDIVRNLVIDTERMVNPPGVVSDSDLDYAEWGSWGNFNRSLPESQRIYNSWLPAHRNVISASGLNLRGQSIPSQQTANPDIQIVEAEALPASGNQDEEYIALRNFENTSIDLSGWTLSGAIDYTFPAGTVILRGDGNAFSGFQGALFIARKAEAFRSRSTGATGGQRRYVQGGYDGQLSARGETVILKDPAGSAVHEFSYPATPSDSQRWLRVTEINYHPADPTAAELAIMPSLFDSDFEFVELMNTGSAALDLSGARFSEGIDFEFPNGTTLGAGARLILAKNPAAFALRYSSGVAVVGPYAGLLSNGGETLKLRDAVGENVLDIDYEDYWYPETDGGGASLVLRDVSTEYNLYDAVGTWGGSRDENGSPGFAGAGWLTHFNAWSEMNYTAAQREPGGAGHATSDVDGDGLLTWMEYALGTDPIVPNDFSPQMQTVERQGKLHVQMVVERRIGVSDYEIVLESGENLNFTTDTEATESIAPAAGGREEVTFEAPDEVGASPQKFYRLKLQPK